jgi:hypothetical protein
MFDGHESEPPSVLQRAHPARAFKWIGHEYFLNAPVLPRGVAHELHGIHGTQPGIRTPPTFVFIDAADRGQRMEPPGPNEYDHEHATNRADLLKKSAHD